MPSVLRVFAALEGGRTARSAGFFGQDFLVLLHFPRGILRPPVRW